MKLRINLNAAAVLLALTLLAPMAPGCPTPPTAQEPITPGVLIMAHGGSEQWNQSVQKAIEPLQNTYPIEIAFGMAKSSTLQNAVTKLENQGVNHIAVVRMFISGTSFLDKTKLILGLQHNTNTMPNMPNTPNMSDMPAMPDTNTKPNMPDMPDMKNMPNMPSTHTMEPPTQITTNATIHLSTQGLSTSTLVDDILIDRVQALSTDPSNEALLILAHGPGDDQENKQWLIDMQRRTQKLQTTGDFIDIRCETLREDWPGARAQAEQRIRDFVQSHNDAGTRVIVIPFRVAGFGPYAKVLQGLTYTADHRGFTPHPNITTWINQTAQSLLPSLPNPNPNPNPNPTPTPTPQSTP